MDSLQNTDTQDPLRQWSDMISRRAKGMNIKAAQLTDLLKCDTPTAQKLLNGGSFTGDLARVDHVKLMNLLGLNVGGSIVAPIRTQVEQYFAAVVLKQQEEREWQALLAEEATAQAQVEEHPRGKPNFAAALGQQKPRRKDQVIEEAGASSFRDRVMADGHDSHESPDEAANRSQRGVFHDDPAIKKLYRRMHDGGAPYYNLPKGTLEEYLAHTTNAYEYLACYRSLKFQQNNGIDYTKKYLGEKIGTHYYPYENGNNLPAEDVLQKIREHVFGNDISAYNKYVNLVIMNRQALIDASDNKDTIGHLKSFMPSIYWQESIACKLYPDQWKARPDKPLWQPDPIETQGDYFRACRNATNESAVKIARISGISSAIINDIENNKTGIFQFGEARQKLIHYYQIHYAKTQDRLDYFDAELLESLPFGTRETKPLAYWHAVILHFLKPESIAVASTSYFADRLKPIDTLGQYLAAMRQGFGLTIKDVKKAINITFDTITKCESDEPVRGSALERLAAFYAGRQKEITDQEEADQTPPDQRKVLFDKEAFDALLALHKETLAKHKTP